MNRTLKLFFCGMIALLCCTSCVSDVDFKLGPGDYPDIDSYINSPDFDLGEYIDYVYSNTSWQGESIAPLCTGIEGTTRTSSFQTLYAFMSPYYSHIRADEVCAGLYNEGYLMRIYGQYSLEYEFTILSVSDDKHKWHSDGTGDSLEEFGIISITDNDTGHPMIHFADYAGEDIRSIIFEVDHRAVNAPSSQLFNGVFDVNIYRWPHNSILDQLYNKEISYNHFFFEISKIGGWHNDIDWESYIEKYPELAEEEEALKNSQVK